MANFLGFSQRGLDFLFDNKMQNSRQWFAENRAIYDNELIKPFRALVEDLTPTMLKIDQWFETKPAIGKTISRIHRDTRFSKDKSIYRDCLWFTFKRLSNDWKEAPCYFFELSPTGYRYGLGYYCAPKTTMDIFRQEVLKEPEQFIKSVKCVKKPFQLEGESYKRQVVKDQPEIILDWCNRKSFAIVADIKGTADLNSSDLVKILAKGFKQLEPIYHYLMKVEFIKAIPAL
ncbi:DUF2461 domain-containing protein [Orbaceae bacterium ac157xtp]